MKHLRPSHGKETVCLMQVQALEASSNHRGPVAMSLLQLQGQVASGLGDSHSADRAARMPSVGLPC